MCRRCLLRGLLSVVWALEGLVDWSLVDVVRGWGVRLGWIGWMWVQPVLWAVMVSLAALWESFGVRPAAVVGHSQGRLLLRWWRVR
ncbi:acyltransferase domain-containing protein [Streptomyces sp. B21-106]|uniref:acyltransferase domain-containing protein n=1 Tax=Streptomyces sp. B21-106 TaxID=3039418 RepID=UPI002FEF8B94